MAPETARCHDRRGGSRDGLQDESVLGSDEREDRVRRRAERGRNPGDRGDELRQPEGGTAAIRRRGGDGRYSIASRHTISSSRPNERGFERALEAGADAIAVFTSTTEHSPKRTWARQLTEHSSASSRLCWKRNNAGSGFEATFRSRSAARIPATSSPEPRFRSPSDCLSWVRRDLPRRHDRYGDAGFSIETRLHATRPSIPIDRLALHLHDTAGTALANVEAALELGVRTFDSAAGGLGGCPFAPGAPGNLGTERLIERLEALGLRTGTELEAVVAALDVVRPYVPRLGRLRRVIGYLGRHGNGRRRRSSPLCSSSIRTEGMEIAVMRITSRRRAH